jgi:hypothetical protein
MGAVVRVAHADGERRLLPPIGDTRSSLCRDRPRPKECSEGPTISRLGTQPNKWTPDMGIGPEGLRALWALGLCSYDLTPDAAWERLEPGAARPIVTSHPDFRLRRLPDQQSTLVSAERP